MEISMERNSWHSHIYEELYNKRAPEDLCNYFWAVIFALVTLPLWCIITKIDKSLEWPIKIVVGAAMYGMAFLVGFSSNQGIIENFPNAPVWLYFIGHIIVFVCMAVATVVMIGTIYLHEEHFKPWFANRSSNQSTSLFTAKLYAAKKKVCPRIKWKG